MRRMVYLCILIVKLMKLRKLSLRSKLSELTKLWTILFATVFYSVSMFVTIVVNFERSAHFANFVNFKNI